MLIRYGYEITLTCENTIPLVCLLSVHEDRDPDIRVPETTFTTPDVPVSTYRDLFGNRCKRLVAPAGDFMIWGDATIEDDGNIDPTLPHLNETPVSELPDACISYLLGSRYCETDRLSQIAWDMFGRQRRLNLKGTLELGSDRLYVAFGNVISRQTAIASVRSVRCSAAD